MTLGTFLTALCLRLPTGEMGIMLDVIIQSLSHVQLFVTAWTAAIQAPPSFTISQSLFQFMPIELMMLSNCLIPCLLLLLCLQSFPASGSFPMSQLFASCGQSIGASASTSVLPMNTQDWFPLGWTGMLQARGRVKELWTLGRLIPDLASRILFQTSVVKNLPANAGDMGLILGREDSTCCGATKRIRSSYWACTP